MKLKMLVLVVIILGIICSSANVFSYEEALGFRHPLNNWEVGCNNFWSDCNQPRHLGDDATADAGASVYAPAAGIVRHAQDHPIKDGVKNYGGLIIIEHLIAGEYVCSVLGHLKPEFEVSEIEEVSSGQLLGFTGTKEEGGGYDPHLHYGIRKGQYGTGTGSDCGKWIFAGYGGCDLTKDKWYDPSEFIQNHPYMVGYFPDGWHTGVSDTFLTAYHRNGGYSELGSPWDNSYVDGPYVHCWPDDCTHHDVLDVQDFLTEDDEWSMLVRNEHKDDVYLVKGCVLHKWFFGWGYSDYGPPTEDTQCVGGQCFQAFNRGEIVCEGECVAYSSGIFSISSLDEPPPPPASSPSSCTPSPGTAFLYVEGGVPLDPTIYLFLKTI